MAGGLGAEAQRLGLAAVGEEGDAGDGRGSANRPTVFGEISRGILRDDLDDIRLEPISSAGHDAVKLLDTGSGARAFRVHEHHQHVAMGVERDVAGHGPGLWQRASRATGGRFVAVQRDERRSYRPDPDDAEGRNHEVSMPTRHINNNRPVSPQR